MPPVRKVRPEALTYFCRACNGRRIHLLAPRTLRYHCATCDHSVSYMTVASQYSVADWDDPDLLLILSPDEDDRWTNQPSRGIMDEED